MDQHTCISRPIAPEDIRKGMYVAVLSITHELLPLFCESAWVFERGEPYRMAFLPDEEELQPLKVISLCLPFVLVKDAGRRHRTLDVRRHRLAHLSDKFGRKFFKSMRRARRKSSAAPTLPD